MLRQTWDSLERFLENIPRVALLALAVLFLREPMVAGRFAEWAWYFQVPVELVLMLLVAMAVAAAARIIASHGNEGPAGAPVAAPPARAGEPPKAEKPAD